MSNTPISCSRALAPDSINSAKQIRVHDSLARRKSATPGSTARRKSGAPDQIARRKSRLQPQQLAENHASGLHPSKKISAPNSMARIHKIKAPESGQNRHDRMNQMRNTETSDRYMLFNTIPDTGLKKEANPRTTKSDKRTKEQRQNRRRVPNRYNEIILINAAFAYQISFALHPLLLLLQQHHCNQTGKTRYTQS